MAKYIEEYNAGICVDSLNELSDIFKEMSEQEYSIMCKNVMELRKKLITGNNLKEMLSYV